ncbi:MAG TPA: hypothetical protein VM076_07775 [Gemmatimonadaceae bacterium]|nr:hypothetical protein [Gemmatimonadaceae bacterium]
MITRVAIAVALCCTATFAVAKPAAVPTRGAESLLDSLVRANARSLSLERGHLSGPGAEWLLAEAGRAQFVAVGEEHNVVEIPEAVTALLTDLQPRAGYRYVALEQDPVAMRAASIPPMRGRLDSLTAYARRYPHAFTFISDQELAMVSDVGRITGGKGNPVWGLDQSFGASHALDRLAAVSARAPAEAVALLRAYRDTASVKEKVRDLEKYHYMAAAKSEDFTRLGEALRVRPGSEPAFIIENLVLSDRVYRRYRDRQSYLNGFEREELMKQRFMDEYRRAEVADGRPPKVILKFGHWHLYRGVGPSNLQTLGNFVSELARAHGAQSLHISVHSNNAAGGFRSLATWPDSFPDPLIARSLPTDRWTIVDLRPLRMSYRQISAALRPDQRDQFARLVFGFDVALYVGGMRPATYAHSPGIAY